MSKILPVAITLACMLQIGIEAAQTQTLSLGYAIRNAVAELSDGMERNTGIAVVSMESSSALMSNHLIDEMIVAFVNTEEFLVLNRAQLELITAELDLHLDGWVDDATAQSIGRFAGARFILTGVFEPFGDVYRFRVQVIEAETAIIRRVFTAKVRNDGIVAFLLGTAGRTVAEPVAPIRQARPPREGNFVNWLSLDATFWGGGIRYERDLNERFSIGGIAFWNMFAGLAGSYSAGALITIRFFPGGSPFYLELGMGWGTARYREEYEFPRGTRPRAYRSGGFMVSPALGARLDVGRVGGFFLNPFISLPVVFGRKQWVDGWRGGSLAEGPSGNVTMNLRVGTGLGRRF